jgi:Ca-activated chloride channel family protein
MIAGAVAAVATSATEIRTAQRRSAPLRVDVDLVLIPVTVMDHAGRTVSGLRPEDFTVLQEGTPQRIVSLSIENTPASIGSILDISGSMKRSVAAGYSVIQALLKGADADDEALLLTFSDRPTLLADLTPDFDRLERVLQSARPGGRTALIDAVYFALDRMRSARHNRKGLVVVSDGSDNYSRYSKSELMVRAMESDVQIHTIRIGDPPLNKKPIELVQEHRAARLLEDLARATGGLHFVIRSTEEAGATTEKINRALHNQYMLGYYPPDNGPSGAWRRIQVKLEKRNMRLYSRSRYFVPGP